MKIVELLFWATFLKAAYKKHPDAWPQGWSVENYCEKSTDTQVFWAMPTHGDRIAFLIPGTESIYDAWPDKRRQKIQLGNGIEVKEGPFEAFCSVSDWINDKAQSSGANEILFVGHSLGAAIGDIAARYTAKRNKDSWCSVTPVMYGPYISGNADFYKEYRQLMPNYQRVCGRFDLVTNIFPWDRAACNKHAQATVITKNGHGIEKYVRSIQALARKEMAENVRSQSV